MRVILASASPRRRELLEQIGWQFEVCVSEVEEKITKTLPAEVVEELSRQKAEDVYRRLREDGGQKGSGESMHGMHRDSAEGQDSGKQALLVIGADTIVSCGGRILGKPKSREDAASMLRLLQGRSHHVYTGVTLILESREPFENRKLLENGEPFDSKASSCDGEFPENRSRVIVKTFHEETEVTFYPMSEKEIREYLETGEPFDKAGAYGIQGKGARYVREIRGDYGNVVGLPVGRLYQEVQRLKDACRERFQAVIFDLDGTLSDSIASLKYCGDLAVAPFGYGPFSINQYKYFVGDGAANLIRRCLKAGGDQENVHFEEAYARYREIFRENCMYQVKPYEGIPELLTALKEKGIKIGVFSNKPHEETLRVIETLFGKDCFDVVQGQQPGIPIKPSPEGAFRILEKMGVKAEKTIYLGDTGTDMKTGKALGAFTVGALWGFRDRAELEENHADALVSHPSELLSMIES